MYICIYIFIYLFICKVFFTSLYGLITYVYWKGMEGVYGCLCLCLFSSCLVWSPLQRSARHREAGEIANCPSQACTRDEHLKNKKCLCLSLSLSVGLAALAPHRGAPKCQTSTEKRMREWRLKLCNPCPRGGKACMHACMVVVPSTVHQNIPAMISSETVEIWLRISRSLSLRRPKSEF